MKAIIQLLACLISIASAYYCMTKDKSTTTQGLSSYLRVCCIISNLGRTHTIKGNGITKYILCPKKLPQSCPERDCKIWYMKGNTISGSYTVYPEGKSPVEVYCDMDGLNCDGEGGWTRIGYLDMTQSGATCPGLIRQYNYNVGPLCAKAHFCSPAFFPSNGISYNKVCGKLRGYQYRAPVAFHDLSKGIESNYVEGISITHGSNPRRHIWTYAVGINENSTTSYGCPCNTGYKGGRDPGSTFVGSHYYCESGVDPRIGWRDALYPNDPLWDGQQCDDGEAACCPANSKMPWFYRSLEAQTEDDIELRMCGRHLDGTPIDIIIIYIK